MQKNALPALSVSLLLIGTLIANHALPRAQPASFRVVPIERLPRQIGEWSSDADLPIETRVSEVLPHSRMVSRLYHNQAGQALELLLQTSTVPGEFHKPYICQPGQGWNMTTLGPTHIGAEATAPAQGPSAFQMEMQMDAQQRVMLYWYTSEPLLDKWQSLREKLLSGNTPTRLFVRIIVPVSTDGKAAKRLAHDFAQQALPFIEALEKQS